MHMHLTRPIELENCLLCKGDSLTGYHLGNKFSTRDQDNDGSPVNCAMNHMGGWWFNACDTCHLNGLYLKGSNQGERGVEWDTWKGRSYSLRFSEMKVRPSDL